LHFDLHEAYRLAVGSSFEWVLLAYRLPREPSTPRITVWRKLKRLGVAQILDGLVALPADARTREQLEWIADEVVQAGGSASVWLGRPGSAAQERSVATVMADAIAEEYRAVIADAAAAIGADIVDRRRTLARLRRELHRIGLRDHFPPIEHEQARAAVRALGELVEAPL
jgi:hypothetical protein